MALPLLRGFDESSANITCVGGHWYVFIAFPESLRAKLTYRSSSYCMLMSEQWSETNVDRHVQMVEAMLTHGILNFQSFEYLYSHSTAVI
jgi:hypothetical protein